jgi:hypothetical protein
MNNSIRNIYMKLPALVRWIGIAFVVLAISGTAVAAFYHPTASHQAVRPVHHSAVHHVATSTAPVVAPTTAPTAGVPSTPGQTQPSSGSPSTSTAHGATKAPTSAPVGVAAKPAPTTPAAPAPTAVGPQGPAGPLASLASSVVYCSSGQSGEIYIPVYHIPVMGRKERGR